MTEFVDKGRIWLRGALEGSALDRLRASSELGGKPGARVSRQTPLWDEVAHGAVAAAMGTTAPDMVPVRLLSFDKTEGQNWGVPWHQDRVIAVKARHEVPGFSNWSQKAGVWHCEPPLELLRQMLFVRVHLDDNLASNGAMQIALGSHQEGAVATGDAEKIAAGCDVETCEARAGDILVMSMLLLHRSKPSEAQGARRVLRVDCANAPLRSPLGWA